MISAAFKLLIASDTLCAQRHAAAMADWDSFKEVVVPSSDSETEIWGVGVPTPKADESDESDDPPAEADSCRLMEDAAAAGPAAPASGSLEETLGDVLAPLLDQPCLVPTLSDQLDAVGHSSGSAAPGSQRQLKRNDSTASSCRMRKRWRSLAQTEFEKSLDWSQKLQEKMRADQKWADQLLRVLKHELDQRKARGGLSRAMVFESLCTATGACIYNWQAGHKLLSLTHCNVMFRVFLFVMCSRVNV